MNEKFIIYKHENLINNKVYIGCTRRTIKARSGKNGVNYSKNKRFWEDIQKFGWDNFKHEIIYDNIETIKEASEIEQNLLDKYKSYLPEYGYNIQSKSNAEGTCNNKSSIKVYQYKITGEFVNEYKSINDAASHVGCDSSQISRSCKKHNNQAGGYLWRTEKFKCLPAGGYKKRYFNGPIFCFDMNYKLVNIYNSFNDIEKKHDLKRIKKNINENNFRFIYNNFKWSKSICPFRICNDR